MARFCTSCGSSLAENAGFCSNCGTAVATPPSPQFAAAPVAPTHPNAPVGIAAPPPQFAPAPVPPAYPNAPVGTAAPPPQFAPAPVAPNYPNAPVGTAAPPPQFASAPVAPTYANPAAPAVAKKGSALTTILLVIGGLFLLVVGLAVAGLIYVGVRAKNAVERAAAERGIRLDDFTSGERGDLRGANPCSFLTVSEASQILGVSIVRTETAGNTCNYFASNSQANAPGPQQRLEKLKEAKGNDAEKQELERIAKGFVGSAVPTSAPYLTVEYNEDGKAHMAGVKLAAGAMGEFEKISGVGDEAMVGPLGSIFVFLYKGTAVQMDLRQVSQGRDRGIELAKKISSRL